MPIGRIKKRDGEIVDFERSRIERAIAKAYDSVGESDKDSIIAVVDSIVSELDTMTEALDAVADIEFVQDLVERMLMRHERYSVAKAYIIYRAEHRDERTERHEKLVKQFEQQKLKVTKSDGTKEFFDLEKLRTMFDRAVRGYESKCSFEDLIEAFKKNLVENIRTRDIAKLLVKTCLDLISVENIAWQEVAARFALFDIYKQAIKNRGIGHDDVYKPESYKALFDDYIARGLYYKDFYKYYSEADILAAGARLRPETDTEYTYTTVLSLNKRYLLNPNKIVRELPQEAYMSAALFLAIPEPAEKRLEYAFRIYDACSRGKISLPTPTFLNARTNYHQLSSCFKISVDDDLRGIYHAIENMAQISKFGGGIGVYMGNIRSRGGMIRGVKGVSGGVAPWTKVINDTAIAVNQLGSRLGSISVTLDCWHRDINDFLDLQTETGDIRSKSFDIFPSMSVPDIFMRRVRDDGDWTLFDPNEIERVYGYRLQDFFGDDFDREYAKMEADARLELKQSMKAKDLFKKFLKTTVETGMPYVFFRDTVNRLNPNKHAGNIYSTQLCTEIAQNMSPTKFVSESIEGEDTIAIRYKSGDLVTCNLASINVAKVYEQDVIDDIHEVALHIVDNVIDLNYFPIEEARRTSLRYRSVGIGYLGMAEYLATHGYAYDTPKARQHTNELFERYAYATYRTSVDLARERGHYDLYPGSEYSKGVLLGRRRDDFMAEAQSEEYRAKWNTLFDDMAKYGVRFSYHTAPAPNTSTAGLVGTTAALLPIYKKYFVETNLSSPTVRVAPKLDASNFWLYKEYVNMDMVDVIDMISVIYRWVDQAISFEWMIDPSRVSPQMLYAYYFRAWEQGIKTVYYVRSLSGEVETKDNCVSCSG
jgi:ribonucleoside-diphosphate reductase alpha chain